MRKLLFLNLLLFLCFGKGLAQNITSFLPLSGTTGSAIFIKGSGFTNASAVTIGGTNVSVYSALDDNTIYAIVPSTASGSVTVTNAAQTSTATLTGFTYSAGITPTATAPSVGDGTSGNPYQIANLQNLYWLTSNSSAWSKYFIQTANIDAAEASTWTGGAGITPIGNNTTYFTGHYDGQGFSIDNLFINQTSGTKQIGLFGRTSGGAVISNLTLSNPRIVAYTTGQNGGFAGQLSNVTVTNCAVKNGVICGGTQGMVGGFVGNITTGATVTNCSADINAYSLAQYAGGFVSLMDDATAAVKRSFCVGKVSGAGYQGGFLGWPSSGSVSDCYTRSNVVSIGNLNGGFTGFNNGTVVMTNCYATGTVMGTSFYGGFGGYNSGNTYSHCYWNKTTSALTNGFGGSANAGVTGITSTEMQTAATFTAAGWDFANETTNGTNDYWTINSSNNDGFPYLTWQYFAAAPTITSFTPTSGNVGTSVTLTGTGFSGVTSLTVGGVAVTSYTVNSLTSITFTVPAGASSGNVSVTTSLGTFTTSSIFSVTNLSVFDSKESKVLLFPNPAKDFVTISNLTRGAEVALFDVTGKLLYQTKALGTTLIMNTSSYKNGVYLVKVDGQVIKLLISK